MSSSEKEPAYGYLRVLDLTDDEVEVLEKQLHEYASANNLRLLDIHHARDRQLNLGKLVALLRRGGIQHLIDSVDGACQLASDCADGVL